jgi:transposase
LPLNLEVIFEVSNEVITFNNLIKDIDLNQFFPKRNVFDCESRGRKQKSRANILKAILFAFSLGIKSTRDIEDLCKHDTRFMFLLDRIDTPSHTTINRIINSLVFNIDDVLVEINERIIKHDQEVDPNIVYIDGTKLEAYANKYTFVWKKSVLKFKDKLTQKIITILPDLNDALRKHDFPVLTVKDSYDTNELLDVLIQLNMILDQEGISAVYGKGKRKEKLQRLFDTFEEDHQKMGEYQQQ